MTLQTTLGSLTEDQMQTVAATIKEAEGWIPNGEPDPYDDEALPPEITSRLPPKK